MLSLFQLKKKKKMNQVDILKWFFLSGIDEGVSETPVNHFQSRTNRMQQRVQLTPTVVPANVPVVSAEDSFVSQAQQLSLSAMDLSQLRQALDCFDGCSLKKTAVHTLDGMGFDRNPDVLCVIDTPKSADEKAGQLGSGDGGVLLFKMLKAIQLDWTVNTYIAPLIPWRLPGDRKPTETEVAVCLPFFKRRIALLQPRFILIFGSLATKALLDIDSVPKARQQSLYYSTEQGNIPVIVTFGPDMVVKGQSYRTNAWADLQKLQKMILEQKENKNA